MISTTAACWTSNVIERFKDVAALVQEPRPWTYYSSLKPGRQTEHNLYDGTLEITIHSVNASVYDILVAFSVVIRMVVSQPLIAAVR
ncbi:hypothetical protein VTL71DRAFT_6969, partial [Oculimacula yallundae]